MTRWPVIRCDAVAGSPVPSLRHEAPRPKPVGNALMPMISFLALLKPRDLVLTIAGASCPHYFRLHFLFSARRPWRMAYQRGPTAPNLDC
ncbi:hypothetical protein HETIRDRAFT_122310 [Heterobasidion irregulare TC 32-1]|uniref:Uncharacterized protein n=1 Tax=Heterobasidion irregulare (strain TC 32-1) TaxID=747525 RepID=W4KJD3_HETIT|nr:uncharacterized protein HETIRDRAFT_122310 [Heterobasidion irregulare TC 32-1]ETW85968.1 hypothetical protein HETIRDRAFT_122310 [Heterobasidion irregulare TC 32-1]